MREAAVASVGTGIGPVFIRFAASTLIGTRAMSGPPMAMVRCGLKLLSPDCFCRTTGAICAIVALPNGRSRTVAGTIGIGPIGAAATMRLAPAITAGAVISCACFGDKSSPQSDTTNQACAAAGADLCDPIRETPWTSVPAPVLALAAVWWLGSPASSNA